MEYATAFLQLVALAALGGWSNAVRGGGLSGFRYGRSLNVALFAVAAGFFVTNWWQVPLCAAAMLAGQAPSVGEIVGSEGILGGHAEAHKLSVQRGAFWGVLISLASHNFGPALAGLLFGYGYQIGYWLETRWPSVNGWQIGEIIFGGLLWTSLLWGWA